ncbi:erythromycin esterase family protein [Massilia sp. Root351]|jgi:erythromycin esterase|uniref:erythromycin esterase family protein n=1 Tax=Massilia sp. Root351 TaxID=1736522 RepID=UPI0009EBB38E|nr:erythromycin esterase family protein [Massilia sp. Root351]
MEWMKIFKFWEGKPVKKCRVTVAFLFVAAVGGAQANDFTVRNPSFEEWEGGLSLKYWQANVDIGDSMPHCANSHSGKCAIYLSKATPTRGGMVQLHQSLPASELSGTVVLAGWIRTKNHVSGISALWIKTVSKEGKTLALDNMYGRTPHGSTDWTKYEIHQKIPPGTARIVYGVLFSGDGESWFDDIHLTVNNSTVDDGKLSAAPEVAARPTEFSGSGAERLHNFSASALEKRIDFKILKDILDARRAQIVALGESGHGVSEFSTVKSDLIKYLHENARVSVVAFESPMQSCAEVNTVLESMDAEAAVRKCLFQVWHTKEVVELFKYIKSARAAGRTLDIVGFDIQEPKFKPAIIDEISRNTSDRESTARALQIAEKKLIVALKDKQFDGIEKTYRDLETVLRQRIKGMSRVDEVARINYLISLLTARQDYISMQQTALGGSERLNRRDAAMAANVQLLAENLPKGDRMVVWAHNSHVARNWPGPTGSLMMGERLSTALSAKLYAIGLIMGNGRASNNARQVYEITQPESTTLEGVLSGQKCKVCFVNLSDSQQDTRWKQKIYTRNWGINIIQITPKLSFDGLIFVNEVSPPKYLTR